MRFILRAGLTALVLAVVVAGGALAYRGWRQDENARALAIQTPNGIEETRYVKIGGIDQWIQIRGEDRANPVLLFMHGGAGASESPLSSLFRPWEKYFTVVMWDQRCAGKTFVKNGPESCTGMSIDSVGREGIALSEFLAAHLHHKKIIIVGHSWGTMIGVRMIHDRPDLFSAYVGTGQVMSVALKEPVIYARAMARLKQANDADGVRALSTVHPPYRSFHEEELERDLSDRTDIPSERNLRSNMTPVVAFAPGWSLWEIRGFLDAPDFAEAATFRNVQAYDARRLGAQVDVPFFVFNGEKDNITPADEARQYFDFVQAPHKAFVSFPGLGHSAVLTAPDLFLRELVQKVRPVAIERERGS